MSEFYAANVQTLRAAFGSIAGYYWYMRLRGFEVDGVDFGRKSFGNSYALPKPLVTPDELAPILSKLVEKASSRMRRAGYIASGIHLSIVYRDWSYWHRGMVTPEVFAGNDIYRYAMRLLRSCPHKKPVRNLAVSCFNLKEQGPMQLTLFENILRKKKLVKAVDKINHRWGDFVVTPALMLGTGSAVPDRISFGGVRELWGV